MRILINRILVGVYAAFLQRHACMDDRGGLLLPGHRFCGRIPHLEFVDYPKFADPEETSRYMSIHTFMTGDAGIFWTLSRLSLRRHIFNSSKRMDRSIFDPLSQHSCWYPSGDWKHYEKAKNPE